MSLLSPLKLGSLTLLASFHRRCGLEDLGWSCCHWGLLQFACLSSAQLEGGPVAPGSHSQLRLSRAADRGAGVMGTLAVGLESPISSFHISHVAFRQKSGAKCLPIT